MTDINDVDALLRGSFARLVEPGDPAGVADSIRTRLEAGDTGTPAQTSGFGSGSWLPWVGLVLVAGLVGGGLGVSGVFGAPMREVTVLDYSAVLDESVDALSCPGGSAVGSFVAGERVLATGRSEDGAYLRVRDPYDFSAAVWLPAAAVIVDSGSGEIATLPVGGCPEVLVSSPVVVPPPTDTPAPAPGPVADTTAPTLGKPTASPPTITMQGYSAYCGTDVSTVSISAADNTAVTAVTATWSGGSAALTKSGTTWSFAFSEDTIGYADTVYSITLVASDAAGNTSLAQAVNVTVQYCLI